MDENIVKEHVQRRTIHEIVIDPAHQKRVESEIFRKSKERLMEDGHYKCFICGTDKNIQIHHFIVEYMYGNIVDLNKAKEVAEIFDIYGYGKLLKNKPLESIDDIRCLMALCQTHHIGVDHEDNNSGTGIHTLPFPDWIIQRVVKNGYNPVPQPGETEEQTFQTIKEGECNC